MTWNRFLRLTARWAIIAMIVVIAATIVASFAVIVARLAWQAKEAFLFGFIGLTIAYVVIFVLFAALVRWLWPIATQQERRPSFWTALRNELLALGPNTEHAATNPHNNRRWSYLAIMMVVTLFIAIANPGAPLLTSGLRHLPADVMDDTARQKVNTGWEWFLHGNTPDATKLSSLPSWITNDPRWRGAHKEDSEALPPREPSWFWWHAFMLYVLATLIYFPIAFWDEFRAGVNGAIAVFHEHRERHEGRQREAHAAAVRAQAAAAQAQPRGRRGQQPPPPPPAPAPAQSWWREAGQIALVDMGMEMFYRFAHEFINALRTRQAGGAVI